jgi:rhodanese-related sulfurtransferase
VTPEEISVQQAAERMSEFEVVDVRGADEFVGPLGHIAGARLLPLGELEARASELTSDRPLLMVCRSGNRSGIACQKLAELGVPGAINLGGGMIAWNEAGLPVESGDATPTG